MSRCSCWSDDGLFREIGLCWPFPNPSHVHNQLSIGSCQPGRTTGEQESWTTSELFRVAFRTCRARQLGNVFAERNELGRGENHKSCAQRDVERLVHEVSADDAIMAGRGACLGNGEVFGPAYEPRESFPVVL